MSGLALPGAMRPGDPARPAAPACQSLALRTVLPKRVGAVLAGHAWRAAAGGPTPSLVLAGPLACGKTTCGKAALSCLSPEPYRVPSARRDPGAETPAASRAASGRGLVAMDVPALGHTVLLALDGTATGPATGPDATGALTVPLSPGEITPCHARLAGAGGRQARPGHAGRIADRLAGQRGPRRPRGEEGQPGHPACRGVAGRGPQARIGPRTGRDVRRVGADARLPRAHRRVPARRMPPAVAAGVGRPALGEPRARRLGGPVTAGYGCPGGQQAAPATQTGEEAVARD